MIEPCKNDKRSGKALALCLLKHENCSCKSQPHWELILTQLGNFSSPISGIWCPCLVGRLEVITPPMQTNLQSCFPYYVRWQESNIVEKLPCNHNYDKRCNHAFITRLVALNYNYVTCNQRSCRKSYHITKKVLSTNPWVFVNDYFVHTPILIQNNNQTNRTQKAKGKVKNEKTHGRMQERRE